MADEVKPPEPGTAAAAPPPAPPAPPVSMPPPPPASAPLVPPGYAAVAPSWRSLRGLRTALTWLLGLVGLGAAVSVVAYANRLSVINDLEHLNVDADRANRADNFVSSTNIAVAILMVAIFVCLIIWTWRAAKNNEALGRPQPRLGPGWAIGGWFIPLAFFVIPVLVIQDLWRGSDGSVPRGDIRWKIGPRSALVGWWWGLFLVSLLRGTANADNSLHTLSQLRTSDTLSLIGRVFAVAAAVLAILVVRRISERQQECLRTQQAVWTAGQGGAVPPTA